MTLTDLIPALKGPGRRRAVDKVVELREENVILLSNLHAAGDEIALLRQDLAEAQSAQGQAEELVVQQQADIDELAADNEVLRDELLKLRARFGPQIAAEANANRIDVPPRQRDTSNPADQATGPIDVRSLQEAAAAGLLGPVLNPGRVRAEGVA
ncbi:hypothetical protein TUSST3_08590 [Streptomyces sp. TUS-ST3]|uniref:hypothetical protein n=1 Tax=Streptomyces sp. TUS-ST3 TaxID=3025591 RepID=UPI0024E0C6CD|nr:hypothetical protein [Streptomyces sp. TUS-ST3]GLP64239.1 hypothetical protein TUSST3_08590 [Streptomyces sp. TUS-ST3]